MHVCNFFHKVYVIECVMNYQNRSYLVKYYKIMFGKYGNELRFFKLTEFQPYLNLKYTLLLLDLNKQIIILPTN